MNTDFSDIKALVFDVFGTCVDFRGSIIKDCRAWGKAKGLQVNWAKFADAWRAGYRPAMDRVTRGELPWTKIDVLHRLILDDLLVKFKINDLTEAERDHLNRVWHRLKPWPDTVKGLRRLKKRYIISTLSNGNTSLLVNMAKFGGLPWDCVLSAETFHHYKPDAETYLGAADAFSVKPGQVMMVAAHKHDLFAAQKHGLKTAFVRRPHEHGRNSNKDLADEPSFTINADDMMDLAAKLGC
jgi:2-haloacid dehalogenase